MSTEIKNAMTPEEKASQNAKMERQVMDELKSSARKVQAEERVKVRLPILPDAQDAEVFCGVNGKTFRIKRGETVEVPESVREVLENCGYI